MLSGRALLEPVKQLEKSARALMQVMKAADDSLKMSLFSRHLPALSAVKITDDEELETQVPDQVANFLSAHPDDRLSAALADLRVALVEQGGRALDVCAGRCRAVGAVEDVLRTFEDAGPVLSQVAALRSHAIACFIAAKVQYTGEAISRAGPEWENGGRRRESELTQYRLCIAAQTMAVGIGRVTTMGACAKEAEIFVDFFGLFLNVFSACLALNGRGAVTPAIHFALTSFPSLDMMKRAVPVPKGLAEIRALVNELQEATLTVASSLHTAAGTDDVVTIATEAEGAVGLVHRLSRKLADVRAAMKFLAYYESFLQQYARESEATVQYRQDTTISAPTVDHFPRFSAIILFFIRAGCVHPAAALRVFDPWIRFIRSVIMNEEVDRRAVFVHMVDSLPYIDFSRQLQEALVAVKTVEGLLEQHRQRHPDADLGAALAHFQSFHALFVQALCSGRGFVPEYDQRCRQFLGALPPVSTTLARDVGRHWTRITSLGVFVSNIQTLMMMIRHLRMDLSVEGPDQWLFGFHFVNFVGSVLHSMAAAATHARELPADAASFFTEFQSTFTGVMQDCTLLFAPYPDQALQKLSLEIETAKDIWRLSLVADVPAAARRSLVPLMAAASHPEDCARLADISRLLAHDSTLDLLPRLACARARLLTLDYATDTDAARDVRQLLEFGVAVLVLNYQISIAEVFIARIICDRQIIPRLERRARRACEIAPNLDQLPRLLSDLCEAAPLEMRHPCAQLAAAVRRQFGEILPHAGKNEAGELAEGMTIIESNQKLAIELSELREDAHRQRTAFLNVHQTVVAQLKEQQIEKNKVRARVSAKEAELRRLTAERNFIREQISHARDRAIPPEPRVDERPCSRKDPGPKKAAADVTNLSLLNRNLKQALALNQQLRQELAEEDGAEHQKVDEFRGLMAVLKDDQDDEDDGMTDEKQERIIEGAFKALDGYKRTNWSNQVEHRNAALELMKHIEKVVCLQALKDERKRKLSNRINALKQSVASCKSVLLQLLNDE